MHFPLPSQFHSDLTSDRLNTVAYFLLEELYKTEDNLSTDTDDNYTRGCAAFGRQKNRIIKEYESAKYTWLDLRHGGHDIVFTIGNAPCRFTSDNPNNPHKKAALSMNRFQSSLFDTLSKGEPCHFCFIIDKGMNEDEEARVVFTGRDFTGQIICQWVSDKTTHVYSASEKAPAAVHIAKPIVSPKRDNDSDNKTAKSK